MSNQPIDNNAISDEELQAASGGAASGITIDGVDTGKKDISVIANGGQDVHIGTITGGPDSTMSFG